MTVDHAMVHGVLRDGVDWLTEQVSGERGQALDVVDVGGGTGSLALELARAGHRVTVVDPSANALATAQQRARDASLAGSFATVQGDAEGLGQVVADGSVDLVLCHGVLDVADDPEAAMRSMHKVLRPDGALSLVVSGRHGAVLSSVVRGEVDRALQIATSVDGVWGAADPCARRFTVDDVCALVLETGFVITDVEGIDAFMPLLPPASSGSLKASGVLLDLESHGSFHPAYTDVAARIHVHAGRVGDESGDGAWSDPA